MNILFGSDKDSVPLPIPKALKRLLDKSKTVIKVIVKPFKRSGVIKKDHDNPLRAVYDFLGKRPFWGYHAFFIALVMVIGASNAFAKSKIEHDILYNPNAFTVETKANLAASVENYTPVVQEDPAAMVLAESVEETSGYFSQPLLTETAATERPKPVEPTEDLQNRSSSITYTVQDGDTLSKIGWKYGLKVATIKYQNELKGETITPGQKLTLPPGDISSSVIAKANQKNTVAVADARISNYSEGGLVRPINSYSISRGVGGGHNGIDFRADKGTPAYSVDNGVVEKTESGYNGGYGNYILIRHNNGAVSRYAHLSSINVSIGQSVNAGQFIGTSGNTGRSTGPHLHFEYIVGGRFTQPF